MLWLLWACSGAAEAPWEAPMWDGDGLPLDTGGGRSNGVGGTDTDTGAGGGALSSLYVVDGVFGVLDNPTGTLGYLVLSAEPITCAAAMTYAEYPYGLYVLLQGPAGADALGGWDGEYRWCGEAPCMSDGFWLNSGASGTLPEEAVLSVSGGGPHRLTVAWEDRTIDVENCQDADAW